MIDTEALVEKIARAIYEAQNARYGGRWELVETKDVWRDSARAALAAIEGSGTHCVAPTIAEWDMINAGYKHLTSPGSTYEARDDLIDALKTALADAYPFVCVGVDRYRRDYGLEKLHPVHAEIADRIANLLGQERLPSKVLLDGPPSP